jgi:hypothetical protein
MVMLMIAMPIQLAGGLVYAIWNWFWPITSNLVGFVFPHSWESGIWYLLITPLSLICVMTVPACFFNLQVVIYSKKKLKEYA